MNPPAAIARPCRCERPVLDGETCLRCGRFLILLAEPALSSQPPPIQHWTRAGVVRALRAFAFFRGRPPVDADWAGRTAEDWPQHETVLRLFGSVEAAVEAAVSR